MKTNEINIRDPYVMVADNTYYLYGTRSRTCWSEADGFDCYTSQNLIDWDGPFEIFHRPKGSWATSHYWAPECYKWKGSYYLVTTLGGENRHMGIYILRSDSSKGPFSMHSTTCLTPQDQDCIDGTLYFDSDSVPWLIFSYGAPLIPEGKTCVIPLNITLSAVAGDMIELYCARDAGWSVPFPYSKEEFGVENGYFTDGPNIYKMKDGSLLTLISSWSSHQYAVGMVKSESGDIRGPWKHIDQPLWKENGGHGMLFQTLEGKIMFTLHFPNDFYQEHPIFCEVKENNGILSLADCPVNF